MRLAPLFREIWGDRGSDNQFRRAIFTSILSGSRQRFGSLKAAREKWESADPDDLRQQLAGSILCAQIFVGMGKAAAAHEAYVKHGV